MRENASWWLRCGVLVLPFVLLASPAFGQVSQADSSFHWSAVPQSGDRIVIKNLNGNIRIRGGASASSIEVRAIKTWTHGDPDAVTIDITRIGAEGVTFLICGSWKGETLACDVDGHVVNNDGRNDTRLDFEVLVPHGTRVGAAAINGDVSLAQLSGEINASTVNGDLTLAFASDPNVDLSVSSVNGTFKSDFASSIRRNLRLSSARAQLGRGGQRVHLSTVNGEMRLVRD